MFWTSWHQSKSTHSRPSLSSFTQKRGGVRMCKLGVISQERLKIEVKLLWSDNRKTEVTRRVDWHCNGWPWMTLNGRITRIARYLCGSWASCLAQWMFSGQCAKVIRCRHALWKRDKITCCRRVLADSTNTPNDAVAITPTSTANTVLISRRGNAIINHINCGLLSFWCSLEGRYRTTSKTTTKTNKNIQKNLCLVINQLMKSVQDGARMN